MKLGVKIEQYESIVDNSKSIKILFSKDSIVNVDKVYSMLDELFSKIKNDDKSVYVVR